MNKYDPPTVETYGSVEALTEELMDGKYGDRVA